MKKFIYKVIKSFSIIKKDGVNKIASTTDEKDKGTTFTQDTDYIDYEFSSKSLDQPGITEELESEGFIKLISTKKLNSI
jgi:hypothetical protein